MESPETALLEVQRLQQAGRFALAEEACRRILLSAPDYASAWNELGICLSRTGRHLEAAKCVERAITLEPATGLFRSTLGNVYLSQGLADEAIACYRQALHLQPDSPLILTNLGTALLHARQLEESARCYERAIGLSPGFVLAYFNLGNLLQETGKPADACMRYQQALKLRPAYPEAWNNLGNALQVLGRFAESTQAYVEATRLNPRYVDAWNNLGNAYRQLRQFSQAIDCYQQALALRPDHAEVLNHLGNALAESGDLTGARDILSRAVTLRPDSPGALASLIECKQRLCDWDGLIELTGQLLQQIESPTAREPVPPLVLLSLHSPATPAQQCQCAERWWIAINQTAIEPPVPRRKPVAQGTRLTVGYLSGDFRAHPVGHLIAGLLEHHDRQKFVIHGYSYGPDDGSPIRQRIEQACDRFVELRDVPHATAAKQIRDDGVDILVDLTGYTQYGRPEILARKPAPIQVSYLGYPGTMGVPFIDYIIVDDFLVPAAQQPFYTERLVHLPGCYQVNDRSRPITEPPPTRAACGLPDDAFVFCCFNNSYKITPAMFDLWMDLLQAIPRSVLWLTSKNQTVIDNLQHAAQRREVSPDRLIFAPHMPLPDYIARLQLADLFMDTFPYNAGATASDALWVGCPVLTLTGESYVARMAGSLLRSLGLTELITSTPAAYYDTARRLAEKPDQLAALRIRLTEARESSAVYDVKPFVQGIEKAYQTMWQHYLRD